MRSYFALYVPTNDEFGEIMASKLKMDLSKRFGGCTASTASGGYISTEGIYIEDNITICKSFVTALNIEDIDYIKEIASSLKNILNQESIAIEIDGEMVFV